MSIPAGTRRSCLFTGIRYTAPFPVFPEYSPVRQPLYGKRLLWKIQYSFGLLKKETPESDSNSRSGSVPS